MKKIRSAQLNKLYALLEAETGLSTYETLLSYFETIPSSLLRSKKLFFELIDDLGEQSLITEKEENVLKGVLQERNDTGGSSIDYDEYFSSFIGTKKKMPMEKTFAMVLMPFLVTESAEEMFQIKKEDVRLEKTKKNMLLLYFSTPLGRYVVYIHKHIKLYEQFLKEYSVVGYGRECDKELLFGKANLSYSHQMRVLREKIEKSIGNYVDEEKNEKMKKTTERTVLSLLMEDIRIGTEDLFFKQL